jgi:hypothetical protein
VTVSRGYRGDAVRRTTIAALLGVVLVYLAGPLLMVPAVALVAFVYFVHHVVAAYVLGWEVPHADVAFIISLNSLIILSVQGLILVVGLRPM